MRLGYIEYIDNNTIEMNNNIVISRKKYSGFRSCFVLILILTFFKLEGYCKEIIPRPEYPRPQFERKEWVNLNGIWTYQFDFGKSGKDRGFVNSKGFDNEILVPFCPESKLSGVEFKDFISAMWYHRTITIPQAWEDKRVVLHFGAIDYKSEIYIDSKLIFTHYGGSASFSIDITDYVKKNTNHDLVIYVEDDLRSRLQPSGKQSREYDSYLTYFTRVTGIWQTVWMEAVNKGGLKFCRIIPDLDNQQFIFQPQFYDLNPENKLVLRILDEGKEILKQIQATSNVSLIATGVENVKTWSPESPHLYDIEFSIINKKGQVIDRVSSYAGMRKVEIVDKMLYLNNEPYYQRLVLNQGYYPDGQWTAPTDADLRKDVELGKAAGFNGARLHQKVFEPRYFYWADKLGFLSWGESANWGLNYTDPLAARNMIPEWEECVERDFNVISIVVWCPMNEVWVLDEGGNRARLTNDLYFATKRLDNTRPVVAASGGLQCGFTDIVSEHTYVQNPLKLYHLLKGGEEEKPYLQQRRDYSGPYKGEPYMIGEFGGIQWVEGLPNTPKDPNRKRMTFGSFKTLEEVYELLEEQITVILAFDHISGFCYSELFDVESELSGFYTYAREEKIDIERVKKIITKSREQAKQDVRKMFENWSKYR